MDNDLRLTRSMISDKGALPVRDLPLLLSPDDWRTVLIHLSTISAAKIFSAENKIRNSGFLFPYKYQYQSALTITSLRDVPPYKNVKIFHINKYLEPELLQS